MTENTERLQKVDAAAVVKRVSVRQFISANDMGNVGTTIGIIIISILSILIAMWVYRADEPNYVDQNMAYNSFGGRGGGEKGRRVKTAKVQHNKSKNKK